MEVPSKVKFAANFPKPVNIFYVWYPELCRRMSLTPAPVVKPAKLKSDTVLDFIGDRLKVDDWIPILNALKSDKSLHVISVKSRLGNCEFNHTIDTEEKAKKMKRRFGALWTAFVVQKLTNSLASSIKQSEVLTYLEFDGVPLFAQYIEPLLNSLKSNKTIKYLSFANSGVKDEGVELICRYLRSSPNIEVLNITGCDLTQKSGVYIAKLIKFEQINRYCESWHKSLRYGNPTENQMRGLKRLTMNRNPNFGDEGLNEILNELEDDLWIKAIDLQYCGITENIGQKIIDIITYNKCLEVLDLRQNEYLSMSTLERVVQLLRDKQEAGYTPEFKWCNTAESLTLDYLNESSTSIATTNKIHKTKSVPLKFATPSDLTYRTTSRRAKSVPPNCVSELNLRLQSEIQKRKTIEKRNEQLESKLEEIKSTVSILSNNAKKIKKPMVVVQKKTKPKSAHIEPKTPDTKPLKSSTSTNGFKVKNGYTPNGDGDSIKNGFNSKIINLFENMMKSTPDIEEEANEIQFLDYFINDKCVDKEGSLQSDSVESLTNYMDELRTKSVDET